MRLGDSEACGWLGQRTVWLGDSEARDQRTVRLGDGSNFTVEQYLCNDNYISLITLYFLFVKARGGLGKRTVRLEDGENKGW